MTTLYKRHGSPIHRRAADKFAIATFAVILLYSLLAVVSLRVRRLRPLNNFLQSSLMTTLIWIGLVFYGLFTDLQNGIVQNAKRCGELSLASAAIAAFLALKPALLPQTRQVSLVGAHKWVARSAVAFAYFHGVVYVVTLPFRAVKKAEEHTEAHARSAEAVSGLVKRHAGALTSSKNLLGVLATLVLTFVLISSLLPVRRRAYSFFYALHAPLGVFFFVLMIFHARPSSLALALSGIAFIVYNLLFRVFFSKSIRISRVQRFGPSLRLVTFEPPVSTDIGRNVGAHVRISTPLLNIKTWFRPSHPYTLVSNNQLVVREHRFKMQEDAFYSRTGPFSSSFDFHGKPLLVVVGGSGVSMLPSICAMSSFNGKVVWVSPNESEIAVLPAIGIETCDVYITRPGQQIGEDGFEMQGMKSDDETVTDSVAKEASASDADALLTPNLGSGIKTFKGRPDLAKVAEDMSDYAVVCCGPSSLINSVFLYAYRRRLPFWSEEYAL